MASHHARIAGLSTLRQQWTGRFQRPAEEGDQSGQMRLEPGCEDRYAAQGERKRRAVWRQHLRFRRNDWQVSLSVVRYRASWAAKTSTNAWPGASSAGCLFSPNPTSDTSPSRGITARSLSAISRSARSSRKSSRHHGAQRCPGICVNAQARSGLGVRDLSRRNAGTVDPRKATSRLCASQASCGLKSALRLRAQRPR